MVSVFFKSNKSSVNDVFYKEVKGLELLRVSISKYQIPYLKIPQVFSVSESELRMEKINSCSASKDQMQQFGEGLALLHKVPQPHYGLNQDNTIGASVQSNVLGNNWGEFFVEYRLSFQVGLIRNDKLKRTFQSVIEKHSSKLADYLNQHCDHPSLVHGDLWSGNVLFDQKDIWLIDPAVYYADREVDIAMTEMFGGFSEEFYQAYDAVYPLSQAYKQKKVIYNLYHYLNHYNLFGSRYFSACGRGFEYLARL